MSRASLRLTGIALLLAAGVVAYAPMRIAWIVGSCTVSGGSFDYPEGECDFRRQHEGKFLSVVSPFALVISTSLALLGGALVVFSRRLASEPDMRSNTALERTREE